MSLKLSHFEILGELGEGGMGVVYKARDLRLDRLVAIKVFPENAIANADRELRFVQEAKAASALNHPNIITIHEIDTVNGVTFTGRRPFTGDTKLSTLAAIVNQEPTPVTQVVEDLPHDLDRILSRCLRKDPARRFQGMSDLHVALEELKDESDSGRLTAIAALNRMPKRGWLWASMAALVALAVGGAWLTIKFATPVSPQRVVAVTTYAGSEEQPSFSPDGNQVAFSWTARRATTSTSMSSCSVRRTRCGSTTDPAADVYPAWSPDGKRIALERLAAGKTTGVYSISPLGGAEQKVSDFPGDSSIAWSPDACTKPRTWGFILARFLRFRSS